MLASPGPWRLGVAVPGSKVDIKIRKWGGGGTGVGK